MTVPSVVIAHPAAVSSELDDQCVNAVLELVRNEFRTVVYLTSRTPLIEQLVENGAEVRILPTAVTEGGLSQTTRIVSRLGIAARSVLKISSSLTREDPRFVIADHRSLPLWRIVATARGYSCMGYARQPSLADEKTQAQHR